MDIVDALSLLAARRLNGYRGCAESTCCEEAEWISWLRKAPRSNRDGAPNLRTPRHTTPSPATPGGRIEDLNS